MIVPCVLLYAQTRTPSARGPVVGVIIDATSFLETGMIEVTGGISDFLFRYVGSFLDADELLRFRREAVAQQSLRAQIAELQFENEVMSGLLRKSEVLDGPRPIGARIVGRAVELLSHHARIDQGKWGGVFRGDGVVNQDGAVGRVLEAGRVASDVLFLTDPSSVLDVVVQRTRARGLLRGEGREDQYGLRIEDLDRLADVKEGDKIVTSGLEPAFPAGILVGEIVEVAKEMDGFYQKAQVKPVVDFARVEHVLVLIHRKEEDMIRLAGEEYLSPAEGPHNVVKTEDVPIQEERAPIPADQKAAQSASQTTQDMPSADSGRKEGLGLRAAQKKETPSVNQPQREATAFKPGEPKPKEKNAAANPSTPLSAEPSIKKEPVKQKRPSSLTPPHGDRQKSAPASSTKSQEQTNLPPPIKESKTAPVREAPPPKPAKKNRETEAPPSNSAKPPRTDSTSGSEKNGE
jgi:rod shape-determining protein MreC